jgi:hypothetical protein
MIINYEFKGGFPLNIIVLNIYETTEDKRHKEC